MFTGIIQKKGIITKKQHKIGEPLKLTITINEPSFLVAQRIGDSICVDGVCLSIVDIDIPHQTLSFQAIEQTCNITTLGALPEQASVHIEPSLQADDKIDGHYVSGHVDQTSKVLAIKNQVDGSRTIYIQNQTPELIRLRGSIAINGVSLTVSDVTEDYFCVCLIPITLQKTNLSRLKEGDSVNLEYDLFLKSTEQKIPSPEYLIGQPIISDTHAMKIALQLGQLGRKTTAPNPWVGSIIVKNGIIIGAGYHTKAGEPHAEIQALRSLKKNPEDAHGATLYCSLEPCCHRGRTGPCTQAIKAAGIKRVVLSILDPDINVQGNGMRELESYGISVEKGILHEKTIEYLKPYLFHRITGKPFVIAKAGMSIDGKLAAQDGTSKWITNNQARQHAHEIRSLCQAVMVGSGTVIKDNPQLTVRIAGYKGPQPIRVILDTHGVVQDSKLAIFDQTKAKTVIFTSSSCNPETIAIWEKMGIAYYHVPAQHEALNLEAVYEKLGSMGIVSVLIEGGSKLLSHVIQAEAFNELSIYLGEVIIGTNGIPLFNAVLGTTMADSKKLIQRDSHAPCILFESFKTNQLIQQMNQQYNQLL